MKSAASNVYSGLNRLTGGLNGLLPSMPTLNPFSRITSPLPSITNLPSTVGNAITSVPSTVGNAVTNTPSSIGNGIWNGSSRTVNLFGRSLVVTGDRLHRFEQLLQQAGTEIESKQWARIPRNLN